MRTPIKKFAEQETLSVRFLYNEAKAGRLTLTKVGARTFIDDEDAARWRALAPKVGGNSGELALRTAVKAIEALKPAIEYGHLDQAIAARTLRDAALAAGVNRVAA
jgi:hypothetical protein